MVEFIAERKSRQQRDAHEKSKKTDSLDQGVNSLKSAAPQQSGIRLLNQPQRARDDYRAPGPEQGACLFEDSRGFRAHSRLL